MYLCSLTGMSSLPHLHLSSSSAAGKARVWTVLEQALCLWCEVLSGKVLVHQGVLGGGGDGPGAGQFRH